MRLLAALLLLIGATGVRAQTVEPVVGPVPPDAYSNGRALIADLQRIVTPDGVQDRFIASLGGVRQYVSVRGADRRNPILLFIHGGPASVELPISWAFQRPWEDYFTVVQWDQRAAGKSFALNDAATVGATLRPDRYRDDAIELIELLRRRYGKRRVFVLGLSWGSTVGLAVAARRPDLLHAYVGMGQLIDSRENERVSYATVLAQAHRDGNAAAVRELEGIAPYPGTGPLDVAKTGIERKWSIHYGGLLAGQRDAEWYFHLGRLSPEYGEADRKAWDASSDFTMTRLWPALADLTFTPLDHVGVPLFFFLGRHDTTPPEIAAAWLGRVRAPARSGCSGSRTAHTCR